ncbi:hypothetical protein CEP52_001035 [Fusarium oligoseptatum]|uniref:Transporter n=1 Tax=Fusarium oligoseptatum TaxID=2604345 RepID=A0A428UKR5_9HYPO|nr:hypothetical protein CEP52_001035 [Fusarium oligoseptatum]
MAGPARRKWYHIQWYSDTDTKEERKFIIKLDTLIVPYAVLAYWVKYIDQSNLNNAYVAGLKEDLGFKGNELVQLQTFYIIGAVVGQIPFFFLLTYIPIHWLLPDPGIAEMKSVEEVAFFYVGLSLGTLTAGLIQAGASSRLDGVRGLEGWRWMYIICAVITIPVGILGFFVLPGTPDQPNRRVLNQHDIDVGEQRLKRAGHQSHGKMKWRDLKKVILRPQFWGIILVDVLFWNSGIHGSSGSFLLWIKSLNRFSPARVNELGTIAPALGIFYTLFVCFASDLVLGPAWAITMAHTWNIIGLIILVVWRVPEAALWFAFSTIYSAYSMSSVFHGWVNTQLRASPAERSFTLVLINAISQSSTAWTPLLVFKTVEAPRFPKGFAFLLGNRDPQAEQPAALQSEENGTFPVDSKEAPVSQTRKGETSE